MNIDNTRTSAPAMLLFGRLLTVSNLPKTEYFGFACSFGDMLHCAYIIHFQPAHLGNTMTTYADYVEQIAKLQALAEAARKNEINDAIKQIKDLMNQHGVTVADLSSGTRSKPAKEKVTSTVAAQFKNPETGKTWTGRGRAPRCRWQR